MEVDRVLKASLRDQGIGAESFDGFLLHEPSRLKTQSGDFYKVFTPFHKKLAAEMEPRDPVDAPESLAGWDGCLRSENLAALKLLPKKPDWSGGLAERWQPGEAGAQNAWMRSSRMASAATPGIATCPPKTARPGCRRIWRMAKSRRFRSWPR